MEFHRPGPNKRVCAYLVDYFVCGFLGMALYLATRINLELLVFLGYFLLKDFVAGQSIGKRVVNIQVVNEAGVPIDLRASLLRNIFLVIPFFAIIEYFVMLRNPEGRRIGDKVAKTKVTDLRPDIADGRYLWISLLLLVSGIVLLIFANIFLAKYCPDFLPKGKTCPLAH